MGIQERKARERQQRVNDILEAAHRVFSTNGFLNTTLQDVAKEAEISVGLIYRYFESKEDIFASLALKGAEVFDSQIEQVLKRASASRKKHDAAKVLAEIAEKFFSFYGPYGEYFDFLIYSYKGLKDVQIHTTTVTRLMTVTLSTLDRLKTYIQTSKQFKAKDEDEALQLVFLLWGILLGCQKLFDSSGRGHLFAFRQKDFIEGVIGQIFVGIGTDATDTKQSRRTPIRRVFSSRSQSSFPT
jgi:AcrR family transcriptional regulator